MKKSLQIAVAVLSLVPILAGLAGILIGPIMTGEVAADANLDSHYRYLSGLLLGIGLLFWSTIPHIEQKTGRFRLLTAIVVVGGLGRLASLLVVGAPSLPMWGALGMELAVTPLLCWWQSHVSQ